MTWAPPRCRRAARFVRLAAIAVTTSALAAAADASAAPTVIATRPVPDPAEPADLTFFVGAISESGRSLKSTDLDLVIDGSAAGPPGPMQSLSEWATASAEASATWRPPVSVGLVYLWVTGVPAGVLDGVQAFFQRLPSRTTVYPTIYGRLRQGRARLTAADVSRLGDVAYLESDRPNLIDAVRLELPDLAADPAALKILLLVTDGRDFADPKGDGPGDFLALGRDLRKAGITSLVVAFPAPEADAAQAAVNLRDLHDAAGGFLRTLEQSGDLENTLESLGQSVADLQRVRFTTPTSWRLFGGSHRLIVRQTSASGQRLNAEIGAVSAAPSALRWVLVALVLGGVATGGGALLLMNGRRAAARGHRRDGGERDEDESDGDGGDDGDPALEEVLRAVHDLIRRGASPRRAVEELARSFPESVQALVHVDAEVLQDPRFPYFRTRPGRMRLQEIRDIIAKKSAALPSLGPGLAAVLAEAVEGQMPPEHAAEMLTARVGAEEWTAFAGLDLDRLAEALRLASRTHPRLARPRARGVAVSIQDALRSGGGRHGVLVGWLVRTGGPGRRGETLRIAGEGRCVLGAAPGAGIRVTGDGTVAPEHAVFTVEADGFAVAPLGGSISVEGREVRGRHPLADGETIGVGAGLYIFKSASAGVAAAGGGPRGAGASASPRSISQRA